MRTRVDAKPLASEVSVYRSLLLFALPWTGAAQPDGPALHRYWPLFPRPEELIVVPFANDPEEGMVLETAAGLSARALLQGRSPVLLYEDVPSSAYQRWHRGMVGLIRPRLTGPMPLWQAVARLRDLGLVRGYALYRYDTNARPFHAAGAIDESANVATALAPRLRAIAVSERLQPEAERLGLPLLVDARGRTEAWCLERHRSAFSRRLLMTADPKSRVARSLAVAEQAFVVSRPGPVYESALARCRPDSPVLGWGCGGEDEQTLPSSEWGLFQTATNWCHNLPAFSTEVVGETFPREALALPARCRVSLRDLEWRSGVHYCAFVMSDGDNVQWLMGNFAGGSEGHWYYENPARGEFPFGWTLPPVDLAQLCPYALADLFGRATPNDDYVLFSGGYYYPDRFGRRRRTDCLRLHARRIGGYIRLLGLRSLALNLQDWDSPEALAAYRTYAAEMPDLDGILTVQYYPYTAGEGHILWVTERGRDTPVVSCRLTVWANTGRPRDTTPAGVARRLNEAPRGGPTWTDESFSFVMAHAWSRFRNTHGDPSVSAEEQGVNQEADVPGVERGLAPVRWTVARLGDHVRVVKPEALLLLVRLHLRTRQTLGDYLASLRPAVRASRSREAASLLQEASGLLPEVRDGDESGRACFERLQRVDRLTQEAPPRAGG